MKFAVLFSLLLAFGSARQAQAVTQVIKIADQEIQVGYEANTAAGSQLSAAALRNEAQRFIEVIRGVGEIGRGLKLPPKVQLRLSPVSFAPAANAAMGTLQLGARYGARDKDGRVYTQNPVEMIPIAAHEFAHLVFHWNIIRENPRFKPFFPMINRRTNLALEIFALDREKARLDRSNIEGHRRLSNRIQLLEKQVEELESEYSVYARLAARATPYDEFYADVFAVLYTEEPNAVSAALHFSRVGGGHATDVQRKLNVRNRQFDRAAAVNLDRVPESHGLLVLARQTLWEDYLRRPSVMRNHKNTIALGITRAVSHELAWWLDQPAPVQMTATHARILNQRLILRLHHELRSIR